MRWFLRILNVSRKVASLGNDNSEYVRTSVGNTLTDISKKHGELIYLELNFKSGTYHRSQSAKYISLQGNN